MNDKCLQLAENLVRSFLNTVGLKRHTAYVDHMENGFKIHIFYIDVGTLTCRIEMKYLPNNPHANFIICFVMENRESGNDVRISRYFLMNAIREVCDMDRVGRTMFNEIRETYNFYKDRL